MSFTLMLGMVKQLSLYYLRGLYKCIKTENIFRTCKLTPQHPESKFIVLLSSSFPECDTSIHRFCGLVSPVTVFQTFSIKVWTNLTIQVLMVWWWSIMYHYIQILCLFNGDLFVFTSV